MRAWCRRGKQFETASAEGRIVGINIGANKDSADRIADYTACFEALAPLADYVTVNVSSPNTPGLRGLQNKDELTRLLAALTDVRAKQSASIPLLLKIAPDLDAAALDEIALVVLAAGIEGLIVSNTTIARPALTSAHAGEQGGLSGQAAVCAVHRHPAYVCAAGSEPVLCWWESAASPARRMPMPRSGPALRCSSSIPRWSIRGLGLVARIKRDLAGFSGAGRLCLDRRRRGRRRRKKLTGRHGQCRLSGSDRSADVIRRQTREPSGGRRELIKVQNRQTILAAARTGVCGDRLRRRHGARHHPRHAAGLGHLLQLLQVQGGSVSGDPR